MIRLVALAAVSLVALAGCGGASTAANTAPAPQATKAPDAPTVTAASYLAVIMPLNTKLGDDMTAVGTACATRVVHSCSAAAESALSDGNTFKAALDSTPVPECLKGANNTLRDGLTMMNAGTTKQIEGMRTTNPDMMNAGSSDVSSGSAKVGQAANEITAAAGNCN